MEICIFLDLFAFSLLKTNDFRTERSCMNGAGSDKESEFAQRSINK